MDEIAKEIKLKNLGIKIPNTEDRVGCILLMDDVVLTANNPTDLQEMLDITNDIANRYHLKFVSEKSKVMKIGKRGPRPSFRLGDMNLDYCTKYKYLGQVVNNKNNLQDHITELKGKTEAAIQTLFQIAGDSNFKGIEMESTWKLLETCIYPIATYGSETWEPTKKEMTEMNKIVDNIIKRILMTPVTTPRETLYIETGLLDIQHTIMKNRINTDARIERSSNNLLDMIMNTQEEKGWKAQTEKLKQTIGIAKEDLEGGRAKIKQVIKSKVQTTFKNSLQETAQNKSKVKHLMDGIQMWNPGKRPAYMNKLTRQETSVIFKTRTRMLDIKNNYRGKYTNITCRKCKKEVETQEHILQECEEGDAVPINVQNWEIFSSNTVILKNAARKISNIMESLEKTPHSNTTSAAPPQRGVEQPGRTGRAQHR